MLRGPVDPAAFAQLAMILVCADAFRVVGRRGK